MLALTIATAVKITPIAKIIIANAYIIKLLIMTNVRT